MPLESSIVKRTMLMLNSRGGLWIKIHGSPFQVAGIPDIIGCYQGRFIAFEVKLPGKNPTKLQAFMLKRVTDAGGIASITRSVDEAKAILDRVEQLPEN